MEKDLEIPSTLFAAPATEVIPLASSQIGFINMFATPLFQGVTDIMPAMKYCVDELNYNLRAWEFTIAQEKARLEIDNSMSDGMFSPRSMSVVGPTDTNHNMSHGDLRVAAMLKNSLNSNPFTRAVPDEGAGLGQYHSLPDITTAVYVPENDQHPSQDPSMPYFGACSYDRSRMYLLKCTDSYSFPDSESERSRAEIRIVAEFSVSKSDNGYNECGTDG